MPPLSASARATTSQFAEDKRQLGEQFLENQRPNLYMKQHSRLVDRLLRELNPGNPWLCCVATGGYGRQTLYPHSDIDLLFIVEAGKPTDGLEQLLQHLWDLGLKLGYAVRTPEECIAYAQDDATILTSLLDARYLFGNRTLYQQFQERFTELIETRPSAEFIEAKLDERRKRMAVHGDSRFLLEPDIKENIGGLRDLHMLHWLARYVYGAPAVSELVQRNILQAADMQRYTKAYRFLSILRIYLHLFSERGDDRLSFDRQLEIAQAMGYRGDTPNEQVERFMTYYFRTARDVGTLTRLFCTLVEMRNSPTGQPYPLQHNLCLHQNRVDFASPDRIKRQPRSLLQLFHTAQRKQRDVHPLAFQAVQRNLNLVTKSLREDKEANRLFLDMLLSPHQPSLTLTRLNESGLLGKFLPDFARLVGQMQFDRYHVYTVDEHILRAIEHLHRIERGEYQEMLPLGSVVIHHISSRRVLFVAMLTHDIGKGRGGGPQALHEHLAEAIALRLGLTKEEAALVRWLVANHMVFSHTAFSRDIDDPKTLADFTATVQTTDRLRLLLLITVGDILAVGPTIWNPWRNALLRELYVKSEQAMGAPPRQLEQGLKEESWQRCRAVIADWPEDLRERVEQVVTTQWLLGVPQDSIEPALNLLRSYWTTPQQSILFTHEAHLPEAFTRLYFCLQDMPRLLEYLAGIMLLSGAGITSCRTYTLGDGTVFILLEIQDATGQAYQDDARLAAMPEQLHAAINHHLDLPKSLGQYRRYSRKRKNDARRPHVIIDNSISNMCSVIEVHALDRTGLLYDIAGALSANQLNIVSTHIMTYGDQAVDVFYVKDQFGLKLEHVGKMDKIRYDVLNHLMKEV